MYSIVDVNDETTAVARKSKRCGDIETIAFVAMRNIGLNIYSQLSQDPVEDSRSQDSVTIVVTTKYDRLCARNCLDNS
jgi:hypothetical protein